MKYNLKIMKKFIITMAIMMLIILNSCMKVISFGSFNINGTEIYSKGECGELLKRDGIILKITFAAYMNNGKEYPAYCLDKAKLGVGEIGNYSVSTNQLLSNILVWKAIMNGYPYKNISELGCNNEKEAFAATKMAVYSVLYNYNIQNFEPIGEAGERTYNALKQILENVQKNGETKISSDLMIIEDNNEWKLDSLDSRYIYKTFKVASNATMQNYTLNLEGENKNDIIITNLENISKNEFKSGEKFKILLPISNLSIGGEIKLKVKSLVKTKPIIIGKAPDDNRQDYALTGDLYEDGEGTINIKYSKNETKIKILKQDVENKTVLNGAKFDLLDKDKNVMYTNLISDEKGEVLLNYIIPGEYYLKETKAPDGYELYEDYIKLNIGFNEEISIVVNDSKKEEIKTEVIKRNIEVEQEKNIKVENNKQEKNIKTVKLPKTGM